MSATEGTTMLPILKRMKTLTLRDASLLAEALRVVVRVRIALWRQRAVAIRTAIAQQDAATPPTLADLRETVWSVTAASRLVPQASCLTQALAAQLLLARRGHVSTVRLSLPLGEVDQLRPHAWLMVGDTIALGGTAALYATHRPFLDYLPGSRASGIAHAVPDGRLAG